VTRSVLRHSQSEETSVTRKSFIVAEVITVLKFSETGFTNEYILVYSGRFSFQYGKMCGKKICFSAVTFYNEMDDITSHEYRKHFFFAIVSDLFFI